MLKILTRKNDVVDILVYPTLVQGPMAAAQIAEGIAQINAHHPDVDVIIIGRGGGSAEELWAFNEEVVARAIYASEIPVISAVGHETDFTISDLVADIRAETPTAAAEMAAPDMTEIRAALTYAMERLTEGLYGRTDRVRMRMDACAMPQLYRVLSGRIDRSRADVDRLFLDAARDAKDLVTERTHAVERVFGTLSAADPKRIMARGYAALTSGGRPVRSVRDVEAGDAVEAVLKDGRAALTVDAIRAADAD
jgi:exodeoxyribonuclease VII large subunit